MVQPPARDMAKFEFRVPDEMAGLRIDQCLSRCVEPLSRSSARVALDLGAVFVDDKRVKVASRKVMPGQHVVVHLGGAFDRAHKQVGRAARAIDEAGLPPFRVLFEDEHLVAAYKPAGLLSAPTPEGDSSNLQALLSRRHGSSPEAVFVVHRLDLQTSGVLVYAKTKPANHALSELFRTHDLIRRYDVFAAGEAREESFSVRQSLSGKAATTHFRRLAQHARFCHLEATLETGRTHQIRRHLQTHGTPVLADAEYSRREPWHPPRLGLHAKHLSFAHPFGGAPLAFDLELPDDLAAWLLGAGAAPADER
jgi:23S rRNA pseudouridine1911/1915/1917 synthase